MTNKDCAKCSKMKKNFQVPLLKNLTLILFTLILISIFALSALAVPSLPSRYYGTAIINDRDAPVNSVIKAKVDGVEKGSKVLEVTGIYGSPNFWDDNAMLSVHDANNGDTVYFYIQTSEMSNWIQAEQTGIWDSGSKTELDLTFTGAEVPKSSEDDNDDSDSDGGGSGGGGGGGALYTCNQDWKCTGWSTCKDGEQTRVCKFVKVPQHASTQPCPSEDVSPATSKPCTVSEEKSEPILEEEEQTAIQELTSGDNILTLSKGDQINFVFNDKAYSIKVKAVGPNSAILTLSFANDLLIKKGETKGFDLDEDGTEDIVITLNDLEDNKISLTVTTKEKESAITGAAILNLGAANPVIGVSVIIIIVILGLAVYLYLKQK